MLGFTISEDDIIMVAERRGQEMSDRDASKWFGRLDHAKISFAAMHAEDMDEQTELAMTEIDAQLDHMGVWDPLKAEAAAEVLDGSTPQAKTVRTRRV